MALQHQFTNTFSAEVAYTGLRGTHLPNTLNLNQLGREFIDRAANDPTVCSLTGNVIIPQGQPGYTSSQRDTCYGAFLRQTVPNPLAGAVREGALSTPTVQRALLLVQFPQYTSANQQGYFGKSSYNALQLRADKRFGAGGIVSTNYTFSRNYGNVETVTGWLEAGSPAAGYQTNNLANEMALSSFDARHRFVVNYVVDLPFGEGKRFGKGADGFVGTLISGWTLNGVTTLQAGFPLGFTATPNLIGSGYGLRPNVDPNCDQKIDGSAVDRLSKWFNTSCFSVPNAGFVAADPSSDPRLRWQLGNAPRTRFRVARTGRQQLESGRRQTHRPRPGSRSHVASGGVQPLQPHAVRPAEYAGDDRREQHVRPGHHPGEPATIDAAGLSTVLLASPCKVRPDLWGRMADVKQSRLPSPIPEPSFSIASPAALPF